MPAEVSEVSEVRAASSGITRRDFLKFGGAGLAGVGLLGTAGCGVFSGGQGGDGGGSGGSGGSGGNTLNGYLPQDIPDMSSTTTTDTNSFSLLANTNEGLYRLDENEEPQPAQAESVDVSSDKLTYTFKLRDGITWSNGDPVTSQDFKYAWLRAMDPETSGEYAYIIADFVEGGSEFSGGDGSEGDVAIDAPDDKTLEVRLVNPAPYFLGLMAFPTYFPLNQKFVEQQGDSFAQGADSLLYNGPYKFTEFDPAGGVKLEKNQDYWDASNVGIQNINLDVIKEANTALNLYETGDLDYARITADKADRYADNPDVASIPEFSSFYFTLNIEDPVISNRNIRKAIQLGFNSQDYVDTVLNDDSIPATGLVPEKVSSGAEGTTFREMAGDPINGFDVDQAQEYWAKGVEELGEKPTLSLLTTDDTVGQDSATFMQNQLKKNLGAEIEIEQVPFSTALDRQGNGDFQVSLATGWGADYDDPMTFLDLWTSGSDFNYANFDNEEYDQLIADAKAESDFEERAEMLVQAEKLLIADGAALAPNYYRVTNYLQKQYIENPVRHPYGAEFDFKYWKLNK